MEISLGYHDLLITTRDEAIAQARDAIGENANLRARIAKFEAKLDRERLARIVSDETGLSGDWCYDAADAIIAYLKEG